MYKQSKREERKLGSSAIAQLYLTLIINQT